MRRKRLALALVLLLGLAALLFAGGVFERDDGSKAGGTAQPASGSDGLTTERAAGRPAAGQLRLGETKALGQRDLADESRWDVDLTVLKVEDPLPGSTEDLGGKPGWRWFGVLVRLENNGPSNDSATDRSEYSSYGGTEALLIGDAGKAADRPAAPYLIASQGACRGTATAGALQVPAREAVEFCLLFSLPEDEEPVALRYERLSFDQGVPVEWSLR